jgi:photosynthetic reaction center cytochrome c subunit
MQKLRLLVLVAPALLLAGCEFGTKIVEQTGPRGTAMAQVNQKSRIPPKAVVPPPPYELTADMRTGPTAGETYQNVQVLKDIPAEEFNYLMASITEWVAPADGTVPNGGCNYCHNPENMASDEIYTKVVARKMIQQTLAINSQWKPHFSLSQNVAIGAAGVTCYTCHRGKPVPVNTWSDPLPESRTITNNKHYQNTPLKMTGWSSLPFNAQAHFFQGSNPIGVGGNNAFPPRRLPGQPQEGLDGVPIQQTEQVYSLMMRMSGGLGVNCTYCHNSHNFKDWTTSRPQRVNAWYGIRMVRDVNDNYISALGPVWPKNRLGPAGDPMKVNCATCHQGVNKPLNGYPMLKDYPMLKGAYPVTAQKPAATAAPAVAAAAPATPVAAAEAATPAG